MHNKVAIDQKATAYLGIGGNLGKPLETLPKAIECLQNHTLIDSVVASSFYRTQALGMEGPDFINAVLRIQTSADPFQLLQILQSIEQAFGRAANTHYQPRPLDLDILLYEGIELQTPTLTLPHPRMHERAFVLHPLYELAPRLALPQGDWSTLLAACEDQRIYKV